MSQTHCLMNSTQDSDLIFTDK